MKKRAPAKKQAAVRKPAAKKAAPKKATRTPAARAQEAVQAAKYTPAPLRTDGSPAFRYPPP
jgi:hypothetical protein